MKLDLALQKSAEAFAPSPSSPKGFRPKGPNVRIAWPDGPGRRARHSNRNDVIPIGRSDDAHRSRRWQWFVERPARWALGRGDASKTAKLDLSPFSRPTPDCWPRLANGHPHQVYVFGNRRRSTCPRGSSCAKHDARTCGARAPAKAREALVRLPGLGRRKKRELDPHCPVLTGCGIERYALLFLVSGIG